MHASMVMTYGHLRCLSLPMVIRSLATPRRLHSTSATATNASKHGDGDCDDLSAQLEAPQWFGTYKKNVVDNLASNTNDNSLAGRVDPRIAHLVAQINQIPDLVTLSSCSGRVSLFHRCQDCVGGTVTNSTTTATGSSTTASRDPDPEEGFGDKGDNAARKRGALGKGTLFQTHDPFTDDAVPQMAESILRICDALETERAARRSHRTTAGSAPTTHRDFVGCNESLNLKFEPMVLHVMTWNVETAIKLLNAASEAGQRRSGILAMSRAPHASRLEPHSKKITVNITSALSFDVPLLSPPWSGFDAMWAVGLPSSSASPSASSSVEGSSCAPSRAAVESWLHHARLLFEENEIRTARFLKHLVTRS